MKYDTLSKSSDDTMQSSESFKGQAHNINVNFLLVQTENN